MQEHELTTGRTYAYREKLSPDCPFLKVKLVEKVGRKGKVKVRFEDGPHPGLEEYVSTRQLVVAWGERKTVLRDEERKKGLAEYERGKDDKALRDASEAVLTSTGEPGAGWDRAELQRILDRAGIEQSPEELHPLAYCDRRGEAHLPLEARIAVAQAFAAAEPQTVVAYLDDVEEEWRLKGNQPGERFSHDYLRQHLPGFALARQWAGLEQEAEMLRKEIARLRGLVSSAASDLKASGQRRKSERLLRALEGR